MGLQPVDMRNFGESCFLSREVLISILLSIP